MSVTFYLGFIFDKGIVLNYNFGEFEFPRNDKPLEIIDLDYSSA